MKILHKIKAYYLRKSLIKQRAENIYNLRVGRREARLIKRELAKYSRLSNPAPKPAPLVECLPFLPEPGQVRDSRPSHNLEGIRRALTKIKLTKIA